MTGRHDNPNPLAGATVGPNQPTADEARAQWARIDRMMPAGYRWDGRMIVPVEHAGANDE